MIGIAAGFFFHVDDHKAQEKKQHKNSQKKSLHAAMRAVRDNLNLLKSGHGRLFEVWVSSLLLALTD